MLHRIDMLPGSGWLPPTGEIRRRWPDARDGNQLCATAATRYGNFQDTVAGHAVRRRDRIAPWNDPKRTSSRTTAKDYLIRDEEVS
jgi:hypothetical protein